MEIGCVGPGLWGPLLSKAQHSLGVREHHFGTEVCDLRGW